jgi:transposase
MSKRGKGYTKEFRYQIVLLVRAGREIPELSKEFGVSVRSIRNWVKQAARDAGRGDQGLILTRATVSLAKSSDSKVVQFSLPSRGADYQTAEASHWNLHRKRIVNLDFDFRLQ